MEYKWTKASDSLPPEPKEVYTYDEYLATVINNQVVAVTYHKTMVRGKENTRWEWNGKICPWDIIAWTPFPKPFKE